MKTVGDLKDGVAGLLTGTNLNNVTNLDGVLERAARTLAQQIDAPDASAKEAITLYNGVYNYLAPESIFGSALNDLRPQGNSRSSFDYVYKQPIELFDRTKAILPNGYQVTFEWDKGVPIIRIAQNKAQERVILDNMTDDDGWVASGTASNLIVDETVFYDAPASLRFALTGSGTGLLTKTLNNTLDISEYEDVGVAFLVMRIPDGATATNLTSVSIKIGSSDSNYDSVSDTEGFLGAWRAGEFLFVALGLSASTPTGTPDWSSIDYIQVGFAHTGTFTNMRVAGLFISLPSPHELIFQTTAIFLNDGTVSKDITDDNDEIILGDAAYNLYEHECAIGVIEQSGGSRGTGIGKTYNDKLHNRDYGLYPKYRADNPSEELRSTGSYYD